MLVTARAHLLLPTVRSRCLSVRFAAMVAIPSLGIKKAEEFNKLNPEKRIAKLEEALQNPAFRDAAQAYGGSWKGLTSTFSDVASSFLAWSSCCRSPMMQMFIDLLSAESIAD